MRSDSRMTSSSLAGRCSIGKEALPKASILDLAAVFRPVERRTADHHPLLLRHASPQ
jgi:hypothetical protein